MHLSRLWTDTLDTAWSRSLHSTMSLQHDMEVKQIEFQQNGGGGGGGGEREG